MCRLILWKVKAPGALTNQVLGQLDLVINEGKKQSIAAVAVGHGAHRLAFAMLRSQHLNDESHWATAVPGRSVMTQAPKGVYQNDVTCLSPDNTLFERFDTHNPKPPR